MTDEDLRERGLVHLAMAELHIARGDHACADHCPFGVSTTEIIGALLTRNRYLADMLIKEEAIRRYIQTEAVPK